MPGREAAHRAVLEFSRFPADAEPRHRERMRLVLNTPDLQTQSVQQYAAWWGVIADYVARRRNCRPTDLEPRLAGHVSLSLALPAYESSLNDESTTDVDLALILAEVMHRLKGYSAS